MVAQFLLCPTTELHRPPKLTFLYEKTGFGVLQTRISVYHNKLPLEPHVLYTPAYVLLLSNFIFTVTITKNILSTEFCPLDSKKKVFKCDACRVKMQHYVLQYKFMWVHVSKVRVKSLFKAL